MRPPGGGAPAGGGGGIPEDGNFKKGRITPLAMLIGVLLVVGAVVAVFMGGKSEGDKLTVLVLKEFTPGKD